MAYYDLKTGELIEGPTQREQKRVAAKMRREGALPVPTQTTRGVSHTDAQREIAKTVFLDTMARTDIISASCEAAKISHTTYENWLKAGVVTEGDLKRAYKKFQDMLRGEMLKMGLIGVPTLVIHNGRPQVDKTGKQITYNRRDYKALLELARHHLPEYKVDQSIDVTQHIDVSGIPSQYLLAIDARELLPEEIEAVRQIAKNIEQRKEQKALAIESTLVPEMASS